MTARSDHRDHDRHPGVRGRAAACLLALAALLGAPAARAIPADLRLEQLHHSRWTRAEGAPVAARAMAQSGDGALWLGTDTGLYRFDGVQFERIGAPAKDGRPFGGVSALMAMPDGSLWIGLRFGGAVHWQAGRYTAYAEAQGLPAERSLAKFALGRDGRVWAGTTEGLFVLQGQRWQRTGAALGHPDRQVHDMAVDRDGGLWTSGPDGLHRLPAGAARMEREPGPASIGQLSATPDGGMWFAPYGREAGSAFDGALLIRAGPAGLPAAGLRYQEPSPASRLMGDRDGGLWVSFGFGLMRLPQPATLRMDRSYAQPPEQAQRFGAAQGLSGEDVYQFFEDRDGHIWVSTDLGLDRFRVPRLKLESPELSNAGLLTAHDAPLLSCSVHHGAMSGGVAIPALRRAGLYCDALDQDASGRTWWALDKRLWWQQGGQAGELPLPPEVQPVLGIPALKMDAANTLWVSFIRKGLFRYRDGQWLHFEPGRHGLPRGRPVSMGRDAAGRVWLGFPTGEAVLAEGDGFRPWGRAEGLQVGAVLTLAAHRGAMLVGGSEGLALLDAQQNRVTALLGEAGESLDGVTGIVFDDAGAVWIQSSAGILRVGLAELDQAVSAPRHRLRGERFDHADGLRGSGSAMWPSPSAARDADGRLWFATRTAAFTLHPRRLPPPPAPPAVELRALLAEGEAVELSAEPVALPRGTTRIELRFAAVEIAMPERVRYRYRLDGIDHDWQSTAARSATYTRLAPGDYRFRVAAASGSGPWQETELTVRFAVPAAFHQTTLFYALCAAGAGLLAWLAYRLRIRQLTARIRLRAEAQAQERERIARNLHDTLLQSVQGLVLGVQSLAARTPDDHPEKARIERVLVRADEAVREGRRKVLELRSDEDTDLADWLADLACELSERGPAAVSVRSEGEPRRLSAELREQAMHIGHEAMVNAQKHAQARSIELRLHYASDGFRLEVSDDGIGMRAGLMDGSEPTPGHWGLAGMRERAAALGARLSIERSSDGRTVVRLSAPAAQAYAPTPARH